MPLGKDITILQAFLPNALPFEPMTSNCEKIELQTEQRHQLAESYGNTFCYSYCQVSSKIIGEYGSHLLEYQFLGINDLCITICCIPLVRPYSAQRSNPLVTVTTYQFFKISTIRLTLIQCFYMKENAMLFSRDWFPIIKI